MTSYDFTVTARPVAAPIRKRKSYDVVIDYCHDHDYGSHQGEIGSLNKRFKSMDAAATALQGEIGTTRQAIGCMVIFTPVPTYSLISET